MLKLEIFLEKEQIQEAFDNEEIKFSKKKLDILLERMESEEIDIKEQLEQALIELLQEMIADQFGE